MPGGRAPQPPTPHPIRPIGPGLPQKAGVFPTLQGRAWNPGALGTLRLGALTRGRGGTMIIRTVLVSAVLVLAGVLSVVLIGHLWSRYDGQAVALDFSGIYERYLAPRDYRRAYRPPAEAEPLAVRKATAFEE